MSRRETIRRLAVRGTWILAAAALAAVLLAQPPAQEAAPAARESESTAPLLDSANLKPGAPSGLSYPRPGPRRDSEALFDGAGRNPGSAAHPGAPGRVRQDAPAQHELARIDIALPRNVETSLAPSQPAPLETVDPRILDPIRLSDDWRSDDFPVICSNPDNPDEAWAAWVSYSGRRDEIRLMRFDSAARQWGLWNAVPGTTGDIWRPALAFGPDRRLWILWAQQDLEAAGLPTTTRLSTSNFELYARWFDGARWGPLERITSSPWGDFDQHVTRGPDGALHVVWQSFRAGQSDVYYKSYDGSSWSEEVRVSPSERNDWAPQVAVDSTGRVFVVWDTYDRGDYDVVLRTMERGRLGPVRALAESDRFEARPTAVVDDRDRLWVAWEVGEYGWGKDQGLLVDAARRPGSRIAAERQVEVGVLGPSGLESVSPPLATMFPQKKPRPVELSPAPMIAHPLLARDGKGRITLLVRHLEGEWKAEYWRTYAVTMTADGWSSPALLPFSTGRLSMLSSAAPAADGALWLAWPRDNHPTFSVVANLPEETMIENVYAARYEPGTQAGERLGNAQEPPFPQRAPGHPNEAEDVARVREWRTRVGGRTLRILRGDTHRHTELSTDNRGVPDGSVLDFYRYMLDAAALDYGLITDHQYGADREYWWWLEEKLADLFHAPEGYIAMFGYERSPRYPDGHRNVIRARRGFPALPFLQPPAAALRMRLHMGALEVMEGDTEMLYEELRRTGGISIPHTSATDMGTDWRDNDPEVEPLVEIYQGDRHSYETAGAPLTDTTGGGPPVRPLGYVSNAWDKGYRLGVIASSDHYSTHLSYAMIWTEERSREAVIDAMLERRTYAATDNIVLEFWIGDHFMGEQVTAKSVPEIRVRAVGTRPITELEILRNSQSIYRPEVDSQEIDIKYRDLDPLPGESYYHVRLRQEDGQTAWSSPIWMRLPGESVRAK